MKSPVLPSLFLEVLVSVAISKHKKLLLFVLWGKGNTRNASEINICIR